MADERISEYVKDGTSDPIQLEDLLDFSNYSGIGPVFDDSKKITMQELVDFLKSIGFATSDGGTPFTVPMFDSNGIELADSPITITEPGASLLNKVLAIGIEADSTTLLYIVAGSTDEYPFYVFQTYTGGNDVNAGFFSSQGVNTGINRGIQSRARNSDYINIGGWLNAGASGISINPEGEGFINVGSLSQATATGSEKVGGVYSSAEGTTSSDMYGSVVKSINAGTGDAIGIQIESESTGGVSYIGQANDGNEGIGKVLTCITADGKFQWADIPTTPQIIGGVTLSSSSNTNILNGTYVILADTTTVTSVTSGIGQDSNWTLEITQSGITNQKGVVTFTGNLEKDGGGGANYDVAIFKNGSIVSESEQVDHKLESDGKGQSVTVMAIIEFSTSDTFDIRVSGNGTANDIFCGGGSLYIQ